MSAPPEPANGAAMKPDPGAPSPAPAQRPVPARARPAAAKKEEPDEGPAQPTTYRDIPLYSTDLRGWSHHIMKFASHTRVDPSDKTQFIPPVKLNRKNPPRPRQPPPEPGMPILDRYGKPMLGPDGKPLVYPKPGEEDPATTAALQTLQQGSSTSKSPAADPSLIAPAGNALRNQQNRFKKRVREVFKAPEQQRRWRREEYLPWVLEDFETSMGWESTRAPQPGPAASAEAGPSVAATIKAESERAKGHAPWIGRMEGGAEGGNYVLFVFDERDAGGFKVVPASRMYRFMQKPGYATLSLDEAEDQYAKFQKNHDADRWMMRHRRDAGAAGSSSSSAPVKAESDDPWSDWPKMAGIALPHGAGRGGGGRRLQTVSGGGGRGGEDEDGSGGRRKRRVDEGDYDELDFEEDFADDEERMGGPGEGDNGADDEEARELEERLKREMRAANRVGDSGAQEESADESDLEEEERKTLTGTGKQMKKLMRALGRREGNEAYESDEDKNPYASDESSDEESAVANPEKALQKTREEREAAEREAAKNKGKESIRGTGSAGRNSGSNTPNGRPEKHSGAKLGRPPGSAKHPHHPNDNRPGAGNAMLAQRATSPNRARSSSPSHQGSRSTSPSPLAPGMTADRATSRGSSPVATASNQPPGGGKRKADATGEGDAKRARTSGVGAAGGPAAGAGATSSRASSPSRPGSRAGSPGARTAANAVEQEVIDLVRAGTIKNTGELVQHFKKRLKADPGLKELLSAAVRRVAIMDKVSNTLKVKDGY